MIRVLVAVFMFLVPAAGFAKDGTAQVYGLSGITCREALDTYRRAARRGNEYIANYTMTLYAGGFISALNILSDPPADILHGQNLELVTIYFLDYCRKNPGARGGEALLAVINELNAHPVGSTSAR